MLLAWSLAVVGFEDFEEYLFLVDRDVDEELDELRDSVCSSEFAVWIGRILTNWAQRAKPLRAKDQDAVLWRIGGNPLFIGWLLENGYWGLDIPERLELLQAAKQVTLSIPVLFGPDEPMETAYYMWWDLLISGVEHPQVAELELEILSDLSLHRDERVQLSALHGLGHLKHPDRPQAVNRFVQFHPDLASDPWIKQCREGTVM